MQKLISMKYSIEFKKIAVKDLKKINRKDSSRMMTKIKEMGEGLKSNIKKLTNYSPEYRLRVGDYRVLFELVGNKIIIYRIKHRQNIYS